MKTLLTLFILVLSSQVHSAENLKPEDISGTWTSIYSPVKGDKQQLIINKDLSSYFERDFNGNHQEFNEEASSFSRLDDLVIIKFHTTDNELRYKLVLSGWHTKSTYALYGTMFMYSEGKQFNGLPVSYQKK